MDLKKIDIFNFRSINNFEINFEGFGHRVLVGKNESGKSNVLKAIASCRDEYEVSTDDLRELSDSGYARCIFELNSVERKEVVRYFVDTYILGGNDCPLGNNMSIYQFLNEDKNSNTFIYRKNLTKSESYVSKYIFSEKIALEDWRKVENPPQDDERFETIKEKLFVYMPKLSDSDKEAFEPYLLQTELKDIYTSYNDSIPQHYDLPSIIFWDYKPENNLPHKVNIEEFAKKPSTISKPLANIFRLHGISTYKLKEKIEFYSQSENKLDNWLAAVSRSANEYLKERWSELKTDVKASISLQSANDRTEIRVKIADDINKYKFEQRSDGFRRLITFLLLIGADSKEEYLYNDILLIDEPETHLHPSSARDLRDTLFEIGKNNYVIYATHSVSMIDTTNIENNLIINKENECTAYECAQEAEGFNARSIYAALGQSVYESIKKTNIVVEGYTDSGMLKHFVNKELPKYDLGVAFSGGVSGITPVVGFLELGNRDYLIITDHDNAATSRRKNFEKESPSGIWHTYKEATGTAVCLEDFYKDKFFKEMIVEKGQAHLDIKKIPLKDLPETDRVEWLKKELNKHLDNGLTNELLKEIKQSAYAKAKDNNFNHVSYIVKATMSKLIKFIKDKIET